MADQIPATQTPTLAQWRTAERVRLRAERLNVSADERSRHAQAIASYLDDLIAKQFGDVANHVISAYWPIKAEFDLRFWMSDLHRRGAIVALPVVETQAEPLVFRRWQPDTHMVKGFWNIPVPDSNAPSVRPAISLAPLVGWDSGGYRLGYGGGYFDRTLAALHPSPFVIGVGFHAAQIPTIKPQPHDIPLNAIVTEQGVQVLRS